MSKPTIDVDKLKTAELDDIDPITAQANKIEPATYVKDTGERYGDFPPVNWMNYWKNLVWQYMTWIVNTVIEGVFTFTGVKTFDDGIVIKELGSTLFHISSETGKPTFNRGADFDGDVVHNGEVLFENTAAFNSLVDFNNSVDFGDSIGVDGLAQFNGGAEFNDVIPVCGIPPADSDDLTNKNYVDTLFAMKCSKSVKFLTSGSWVCPANVTGVLVTACGGGGGGKAVAPYNGGGAGQLKYRVPITVVGGETIAVAIGAGGAIGTDGGNTTFGSTRLVAIGGKTTASTRAGAESNLFSLQGKLGGADEAAGESASGLFGDFTGGAGGGSGATSGGGGAAGYNGNGAAAGGSAAANSGAGGGGGAASTGTGGSGFLIIEYMD